MKRLLLPVVLLAAFSLSARPWRALPAAPAAPREPTLSIYEAASLATGAPEDLLRGLAFAESSYRPEPVHPDPADKGMFGLHETAQLHAWRARRWGEYDALNPAEAAVIAGHIYMDNLAQLGDEDLATAAYKQGVAGLRRDGPAWWYVARVRSAR